MDTTPCGHTFHESCLTPWKKTTNGCPVCRQPIDADREVEKLPPSDEERSFVRQVRIGSIIQILLFLPEHVCAEMLEELRVLQEEEREYRTRIEMEHTGQCAFCGELDNIDNMIKCPRCLGINYCSEECQLANLGNHSSECRHRVRCRLCRQPTPTDALLSCACGMHRYCCECIKEPEHVCDKPYKRAQLDPPLEAPEESESQ